MVGKPKEISATLLETRPLTDQVRWFRFALSEPIDFRPGQYVSLRFPGELRYHAFSIASTPAKREEIELVIKLEREFTTKLFNSEPGLKLECFGPMGRFLTGMKGDVVMIAGGVGVTPFLSLVRHACEAQLRERHYWLFYSCKTRADIFHEEELRGMNASNGNVHVIFTLTRDSPPGWDCETGRVEKGMLLKYLGSLDEKSFYTCGPMAMVEGVTKMLSEANVPKERIFTESWG